MSEERIFMPPGTMQTGAQPIENDRLNNYQELGETDDPNASETVLKRTLEAQGKNPE